MKKLTDPLLARIETFVADKGGGVVIRKVGGGHSLFRETSGRPVARFRPIGTEDAVEVKWWSHRERWDDIGDFGPMVLPLDQALAYLAEDPMGCFWH